MSGPLVEHLACRRGGAAGLSSWGNGLGLRLTVGAVMGAMAVLPAGCTASHHAGRSAAATAATHLSARPSGGGSGEEAAGGGSPGDPLPAGPSGSLAPAGPAPGDSSGGPGEDEGKGQSLDLARAIGCADMEEQESLPSVSQQLTCRRGVERIYILTFATVGDRDIYLGQDQQVVPGGWNLIGPNWVIHADVSQTAQDLMHQLGGIISVGA